MQGHTEKRSLWSHPFHLQPRVCPRDRRKLSRPGSRSVTEAGGSVTLPIVVQQSCAIIVRKELCHDRPGLGTLGSSVGHQALQCISLRDGVQGVADYSALLANPSPSGKHAQWWLQSMEVGSDHLQTREREQMSGNALPEAYILRSHNTTDHLSILLSAMTVPNNRSGSHGATSYKAR